MPNRLDPSDPKDLPNPKPTCTPFSLGDLMSLFTSPGNCTVVIVPRSDTATPIDRLALVIKNGQLVGRHGISPEEVGSIARAAIGGRVRLFVSNVAIGLPCPPPVPPFLDVAFEAAPALEALLQRVDRELAELIASASSGSRPGLP